MTKLTWVGAVYCLTYAALGLIVVSCGVPGPLGLRLLTMGFIVLLLAVILEEIRVRFYREK